MSEKRGRHYRTPLERAETAVYWRTSRIAALEQQIAEYREKLAEESLLLEYLKTDPRLPSNGPVA